MPDDRDDLARGLLDRILADRLPDLLRGDTSVLREIERIALQLRELERSFDRETTAFDLKLDGVGADIGRMNASVEGLRVDLERLRDRVEKGFLREADARQEDRNHAAKAAAGAALEAHTRMQEEVAREIEKLHGRLNAQRDRIQMQSDRMRPVVEAHQHAEIGFKIGKKAWGAFAAVIALLGTLAALWAKYGGG